MRWRWISVAALLVITGCSSIQDSVAPPAAALQPANVRLQATVTPADEWLRAHYPTARWMLQVELNSVGQPLPSASEPYSYMVYVFDGRDCLLPSDWGPFPGGSAATTDPYLIASDGLSWEAAVQSAKDAGDLPSTVSLQGGYGFRYLGTQPSARVRYALSGDQPPAGPISIVFVLIGPPPERKALWTTTAHSAMPG